MNIEIADDGAGLNVELLKQKAIERGLVSLDQAARMNEREIGNLIFLPGFSTAKRVTNISGRGVGMDVVKTNIEKIGGTVDLHSVQGLGTTLKIWSAACSSGQEPYSLAMMLQENFPELRQWRLQILATDVCTSVLLKAERGRYSQLEMNRGLPVLLLSRYLIRQGVEWELTKDIRAKVEFRVLNLAENWSALPAMDVILLRHVLIYFDVETKKEILARVRRQLRPDGYMLMGGAETTLNLDMNYERVQFANTAPITGPGAKIHGDQ